MCGGGRHVQEHWSEANQARPSHHRPAPGRPPSAEIITGQQVERWKAGQDTPVTRKLDRMAALWDSLDEHDELVVDWPSLRAEIRTAARV
jgi:hypothetical protein